MRACVRARALRILSRRKYHDLFRRWSLKGSLARPSDSSLIDQIRLINLAAVKRARLGLTRSRYALLVGRFRPAKWSIDSARRHRRSRALLISLTCACAIARAAASERKTKRNDDEEVYATSTRRLETRMYARACAQGNEKNTDTRESDVK